MVQSIEPAANALSGVRKTAILMVILGEATCAEILRQMDEDEVQEIGREIARISSITSEHAETVLEEFYNMTVAHDYVLKGGIDYARKIMISAFGPEQAKKLLDRLVKALGTESASFDSLQKADPHQLA